MIEKRSESQPSEQETSRSTIIVMVATLVSRLLGFVRIAVIGAIFGATGAADVLNLVFNIPNNLRKLLAEGALSSAFVPVLSRAHDRDHSGTRARGVVQRLLGFQLAVLGPLLILGALFPAAITDILLDFPDPVRRELAAELFRWLIHYTLLISVAAVFMGTLNSHHSFLIPALAPLWFSVSVIGSVLLLHRNLGIFSMAVGVLVGGAGQLLMHVPEMIRRGYRLTPRLSFSDPDFRLILRRWLPVLGTSSVFAINQQFALFFASGLESGSGSAMTNALVFWQLPFGIFSASITTVLFPLMSRSAASGDADGVARAITGGLRALILLLIPAGIGLGLMGEEIIAVALQRGQFASTDTLRAAAVLRGYALGLFSVGAFTFLQRAFYACDDYRTPLRVAAITMVIDVSLSVILKETSLRVIGLAVANSVAFTIGLLLYTRPLLRTIARMRDANRGEARVATTFHDIDEREIGGDSVAAERSDPVRSSRRSVGSVPALIRALGVALAGSLAAVLAVLLMRSLFDLAGAHSWRVAESSLRTLLLLLGESIAALSALGAMYRVFGVSPRALVRGR